MGLGQCAYPPPGRRLRRHSAAREKSPKTGKEGDTPVSVLPKCSKLRTFIAALCEDRNGLSASDLNSETLRLEPAALAGWG